MKRKSTVFASTDYVKQGICTPSWKRLFYVCYHVALAHPNGGLWPNCLHHLIRKACILFKRWYSLLFLRIRNTPNVWGGKLLRRIYIAFWINAAKSACIVSWRAICPSCATSKSLIKWSNATLGPAASDHSLNGSFVLSQVPSDFKAGMRKAAPFWERHSRQGRSLGHGWKPKKSLHMSTRL